MGYLAAYNTSSFSGSLDGGPINIAISSSIFSGSTGAIRFGDVLQPPSGGMTIISDSNTQLGVASASATPLFWSVNSLTDTASVLNTINALPERVTKTRFTTTSSAYLYLVSSSKYFPILGTQPLNTPVTDGLVMYLNAGQLVSYPTTASTWYDISGNNNSGSLINGPTFNSNGYIVFDGVDDRVDVPFNNPLDSYSGSLEMVVERKGTTSNSFPFGGVASSTNRFYLRQPSSDTYDAVRGNPLSSTSFGVLDLNKYYHLVMTWDPTNLYAFKNGKLISSTTYTNPGTSLTFGDLGRGQGAYATMNLNRFKAYNKTLSQTEILQNYYQAPIVTSGLVMALDANNIVSYESGSSLTYSLTGSISGSLINGTGYNNINGGTWNFDGVDDYITFGTQNLISTDFTINLWFNATTNTTKEHFIISIGYANNPSFLIVMDTVNGSTANLQAYYNSGSIVTGRSILNTGIPNTSIINLCFVRQNGVNTPYINGVPQTSRIFNESVSLVSSTYVLGWAIPRNKASAYFQGNIYNCSIYNRALSSTEIQQNFNAQRQRFGI
jgi:hypothetical protein